MSGFLICAAASAWATEWSPAPTHSWYVEDQLYYSPATGDFDGDGVRELVWLDLAGTLHAWVQDDQAPAALSLGPFVARSLASGNANGDAYDDLVVHVSDDSGQWIGVALGSATGLLPIHVALPVEPGFQVSEVGDANGDGLADFAFGPIILTGSPSSPHLETARVLPAWDGPGQVRGAGDLNGDGFDDLLVPEWMAAQGAYVTYVGGVAAYAGAPDHQGAKLWTIEAAAGLAVGHAAAVADLDGDADLELVLTAVAFSGCALTGELLVYDHVGSDVPVLIGRRRVSGADPCPGLQLLRLGDDDADGRESVGWVASGALEELALAGTDLVTGQIWSGTPVPAGMYALAEDLDGDGQTDLAATWLSSLDGTGLSGGASVWFSAAAVPDTGTPASEQEDTSSQASDEVTAGHEQTGCGCRVAVGSPQLPFATFFIAGAAVARRLTRRRGNR